jgi:Chitobiase/beta-hexosaminidase C-terminal domain
MKVSSTRGSIVWNGLYRTPGVSRFSVVVFAAVMGCTIAGASFAQDVSSGNRRAPISGLYDWSKAGYREGAAIPSGGGTVYQATAYGVTANDGADDSAALQSAIDAIRSAPGGSYSAPRVLTLPSGTINISRQIYVDANFLIIRGQGSDPASSASTRIVFRPDTNTRYDSLTADGSDWDEDGMTWGNGKGGWIWPGRGMFRVQTRAVASNYSSDYASAPANRKDLFEGSVNQHWIAGIALRPGLAVAAARGDTTIQLDPGASTSRMATIRVGGYLWVGAANTKNWLDSINTNPSNYRDVHMRAQVFKVVSVDTANRTVTIDKPLEFDIPSNATSDGSSAIDNPNYPSRVAPLQVVEGVGFESFYFTQDMANAPRLGGGAYNLNVADSVNNYGNMAPEYQIHGIVFKWAVNSWMKGVRSFMTGSHPVVTEVAKNLQIQDCYLDGAWNKGKGGNGYFRGSRVWDSLYFNNISRNLRHFTFQWSASGNVAIRNDTDSDFNLHGGWERHNLIELNVANVPWNHSSGSCLSNCGGEGGANDDGTWYPIWWGSGWHASNWSGATGPQNVFFNNAFKKQLVAGGPFQDYLPYYSSDGSRSSVIYQFGWNQSGAAWQHLSLGGSLIQTWGGNETVDFSASPNAGVNDSRTHSGESIFLIDASDTSSGSSVTLQENGAGFCDLDGTIDSDWAGFTGAGFANTLNATNSAIRWKVNAAVSGSYTLRWRYANGGTTNRPGNAVVNGSTAVSGVAFNATGVWSAWTNSSTVTVTLAAGLNDISLVATTAGGLANIDSMTVSGDNPQAGNCAPAGQVVAPIFSPAPGAYTSALSVTMSTSTSGATIRYAIGSANPTCATGTVYGAAVNVSNSSTLRAIACKTGMTDSAVTVGAYTINPPAGGKAEVTASLPQDDNSQTKYDIVIRNSGTTAMSGFTARVYVDLTEVFNAGKTAMCVERFDQAGTASCALVQYSGNVYYANLNFGSHSLAPDATVSYKITLRTNDFSNFWNSANDYSRSGLGAGDSITTRIPVYLGTTLIWGTNP